MYKARPNDVRDAYKTAIKLLQYYNCKANLEATRVSMLSWAREKKYLNYFILHFLFLNELHRYI